MKIEIALKVTEDSGKVNFFSAQALEGYGIRVFVNKEVFKNCIDPDADNYSSPSCTGRRYKTTSINPTMEGVYSGETHKQEFCIEYQTNLPPTQECTKCGEKGYNDEMKMWGYNSIVPDGYERYHWYCKKCIPEVAEMAKSED